MKEGAANWTPKQWGDFYIQGTRIICAIIGMMGLIFTVFSFLSPIGVGVSLILLVVGILLSPRRIPEGRRVSVVSFLSLGILMFFWGFLFNYIARTDINAESGSMFYAAIAIWSLGGFYLASFLCQYYYEHRPEQERAAQD